jgi:hypothetical protein
VPAFNQPTSIGESSVLLTSYENFRNTLYKGTNLASIDPHTGRPALPFHPRRDAWSEHFTVEDAQIVPLTPEGRATAALLKLNAPARVEFRALLAQAGRFPMRG